MANIKYHGAVIFKDMGNGILSGKYICPFNQFPLPETSRLITKTGVNIFEGISAPYDK